MKYQIINNHLHPNQPISTKLGDYNHSIKSNKLTSNYQTNVMYLYIYIFLTIYTCMIWYIYITRILYTYMMYFCWYMWNGNDVDWHNIWGLEIEIWNFCSSILLPLWKTWNLNLNLKFLFFHLRILRSILEEYKIWSEIWILKFEIIYNHQKCCRLSTFSLVTTDLGDSNHSIKK